MTKLYKKGNAPLIIMGVFFVCSLLIGVCLTNQFFFMGRNELNTTFISADNFLKEERIENNESDTERATITVTDKEKKFVYKDTKIIAPNHVIEEEILSRKINEPLKTKLEFVDSIINRGGKISSALYFCFPKLEAFVKNIVNDRFVLVKDSQIIFNPACEEMFSFTKEKNGWAVNENRLVQDIYLGLKSGAIVNVELIKSAILPKYSVSKNKERTKLLSEFSTKISSLINNRRANIILALSKINGKIINGSESLSFNNVVGKRTKENGFLNSTVIADGKYREGIGGGVCQVSTTLYNAAVRGEMNILLVKNHSLVPSYVPPSLDAMVSDNGSDLLIKNDRENPVFISASLKNNSIEIKLFSLPLSYKITTESHVISVGEPPSDDEIIDFEFRHVPPLTPPKTRIRVSYGMPSLKSVAYALYYSEKNELMGRKFLRSDEYKSSNGVVAIAP